ncbi:MAG: flagellar basal body P-ring formation chaperone FlgA [Steroidobacteraceae bacterium]|jgi:flagella basal body P-ring formation protein FlgA
MRTPSRIRHCLLILGLACVFPAFAAVDALGGATASADLEDLRGLESLAQKEAALHLAPLSERQRLIAGPIEAHVRLERCSRPVSPVVSAGAHMRDRILVELRCPGAPAWHIYVPVRLVGTTPVAIAARAIVTGSVLTDKDLRIEQRDMPELPAGYLDDPTVAIGLTAARPISSGAVITNQFLVGAKAVQRGQTVTLVADSGAMSIRMEGRALSDALINQRVKVENLSSGKVVEGVARSQQVVEIVLQ